MYSRQTPIHKRVWSLVLEPFLPEINAFEFSISKRAKAIFSFNTKNWSRIHIQYTQPDMNHKRLTSRMTIYT